MFFRDIVDILTPSQYILEWCLTEDCDNLKYANILQSLGNKFIDFISFSDFNSTQSVVTKEPDIIQQNTNSASTQTKKDVHLFQTNVSGHQSINHGEFLHNYTQVSFIVNVIFKLLGAKTLSFLQILHKSQTSYFSSFCKSCTKVGHLNFYLFHSFQLINHFRNLKTSF